MLKIAADAYSFMEDFERGSGWSGVTIAEGDMVMDPIANGLHPLPSSRQAAEQARRGIRQQVHLAITASKKIDQGFFGKTLDRHFASGEVNRIRIAGIFDQGRVVKPDRAAARQKFCTAVAERIDIGGYRRGGLHGQLVGLAKV